MSGLRAMLQYSVRKENTQKLLSSVRLLAASTTATQQRALLCAEVKLT